MINKIFVAFVFATVLAACNDPANQNPPVGPDGNIPDGMVVEMDAGMMDSSVVMMMDARVDSGVDAHVTNPKHWICSTNPIDNLPWNVLASCPAGNAYVGGVTDAKNALNVVVGDFYVITGSNDQLSSNNVQTLYRVCSFDSVNEPVTGNGVTIVDCAEVP